MKTFLTPIIAILFLSYFYSYAQVPLTISLQPGDIRVYEVQNKTSRSMALRTIYGTRGINLNYSGVAMYKTGDALGESGFFGVWRINDSSMVIENVSAGKWTELYSAFIPNRDTVFLHQVAHQTKDSITIDSIMTIIIRRFDTTCFGKPVKAYTFRYSERSNEFEKTIAEHFGLIHLLCRSNNSSDTIRLNSAVLGGVKYNRDKRIWNLMPLCADNIYQYYHSESDFPNIHHIITCTSRDTSISNRHYIVISSYLFFFPYHPLRMDVDGIHSITGGIDYLAIPNDVSLGTMFARSMVVDTGSIELYNERRRYMFFLDVDDSIDEYSYNYSIVDGIGPNFGYGFALFGGGILRDTLRYARICGKEYGTFVNVEKEKLIIESEYLSQNFPNPFAQSTVIGYRFLAFGHVRLEVFDMLGRKVATLVDEEKEAGDYELKFDAGLLNSRIYFYRLTTGQFTEIKKMLIMR